MRRARSTLAVACCLLAVALACAGPSAEAEGYPAQVSPPGPPPNGMPPPPPNGDGVPDGQWAYTQQNGWVWMPYADPYTYVPPDGTGEPLEYSYVSDYGWAWVAAPWVWGIGPSPWFGRRGPRPYAWYQHGYWRTPKRWQYRAPAGHEGDVAHRGIRPAPQARRGPPPGTEERRGREDRDRGERRGGEENRGGERGGGFQPRGEREGR